VAGVVERHHLHEVGRELRDKRRGIRGELGVARPDNDKQRDAEFAQPLGAVDVDHKRASGIGQPRRLEGIEGLHERSAALPIEALPLAGVEPCLLEEPGTFSGNAFGEVDHPGPHFVAPLCGACSGVRIDDHQRVEAVGIIESETQTKGAAERVSAKHGSFYRKLIEEAGEPLDGALRAISGRFGRCIGPAMTEQIGQQH
jgi:hypothetical protein